MTPAISFSCVEKLGKLLSKDCTQTIRPLFPFSKELYGHLVMQQRKPRLKVGDKIKLYWKMRSKAKWFLKDTGNEELDLTIINELENSKDVFGEIARKAWFPKLLGEAIITEVFEINISREGLHWCSTWDKPQEKEYGANLSKLDGFSSAADMFDWFDKNYDLSQPKRFVVYRWVYL